MGGRGGEALKFRSLLAVSLVISLIISSLPMGTVKAESLATLSPSDCATLRVSLPQGTIVGPNSDPWLNEGWILYFTSAQWTLTVRVYEKSASIKSYDTHFVIALNDPAYVNLVSLSVDGITVSKTSFKYGIPKPYNIMTWPSGDVYPTWFDDTSINLGKIYPKSYKDVQVCVTFSNPTDVRMHFDAYGKETAHTPRSVGDITWSANSEDSTVLYQGPPPPTHTLTITTTTGGTTYPSPGSHSYSAGTVVSVTALPDTYYFFDHWVLDGSPAGSDNPIYLTINPDHTLQAVFTRSTHTLTITTSLGGTTNPSPGTHTYDAGTYAPVQAIPDTFFLFDHWELDGANAGSANPINVFMDKDHTLHAVFVHIVYTFTISASSGGTTNPSPGTYVYDAGTTVWVTAVPDPNYQFGHWMLDGSNAGSTNPISVLVDSDHTLHAVFTPIIYTLTITATTGGTTNPPSGAHTYNAGTIVQIQAVPDPYYFLDHWVLDGVPAGSANPINVFMDKDHTLHAVFAPITYTLTITVTAGGTTDPAPGVHVYNAGTLASVSAITDIYYRFDHWELDGVPIESDNPIKIMMDKDHVLLGVFVRLTYTLTITVAASGTTGPSPGPHVYDAGSTVQVTAIPDANYGLDYWKLDGVPAGSANPINVLMDKDYTLQAVFALRTYTLAISTTFGGTTSPLPDTYTHNAGSIVSVTAIPDADHLFDHWLLDGTNAGSDNPIDVLMDKDHTWRAVFVVKPELGSTSHVAHDVGEVFYINVEIAGASNLYGFEFKMQYNTTLLDALEVSEGSFLKSFGATSVTVLEIHEAEGYVVFGVTLLSPSPPAQGNGVLATITFSVTYATECPETVGGILNLYDTKLLDPIGQLIPHTVVDGLYEFVPLPPECIGPAVDVYTQKPDPYSGKGRNKRSDAFGPQEEVVLHAYVHYNCEPVEYKPVAFEIKDPSGTSRDYRTAYSDENGIATTSFRIPWEGSGAEALFGDWTVIGIVDIAGTKVNDTLIFRFGWVVRITNLETCNALGETKTTFGKGEQIYLNATVRNIAFTSKVTTLTIVVCDECVVPIGRVAILDWSIPAGDTEVFSAGLQIPDWAFVGVATTYANAYTDLPSQGGTPTCPETSTTFVITG